MGVIESGTDLVIIYPTQGIQVQRKLYLQQPLLKQENTTIAQSAACFVELPRTQFTTPPRIRPLAQTRDKLALPVSCGVPACALFKPGFTSSNISNPAKETLQNPLGSVILHLVQDASSIGVYDVKIHFNASKNNKGCTQHWAPGITTAAVRCGRDDITASVSSWTKLGRYYVYHVEV